MNAFLNMELLGFVRLSRMRRDIVEVRRVRILAIIITLFSVATSELNPSDYCGKSNQQSFALDKYRRYTNCMVSSCLFLYSFIENKFILLRTQKKYTLKRFHVAYAIYLLSGFSKALTFVNLNAILYNFCKLLCFVIAFLAAKFVQSTKFS